MIKVGLFPAPKAAKGAQNLFARDLNLLGFSDLPAQNLQARNSSHLRNQRQAHIVMDLMDGHTRHPTLTHWVN